MSLPIPTITIDGRTIASDARFTTLGRALGWCREKALVRMQELWLHCTATGTDRQSWHIVAEILRIPRKRRSASTVQWLVCDLAELGEAIGDEIRVRGCHERSTWREKIARERGATRDTGEPADAPRDSALEDRLRAALAERGPLTRTALRTILGVRNDRVLRAVRALCDDGLVLGLEDGRLALSETHAGTRDRESAIPYNSRESASIPETNKQVDREGIRNPAIPSSDSRCTIPDNSGGNRGPSGENPKDRLEAVGPGSGEAGSTGSGAATAPLPQTIVPVEARGRAAAQLWELLCRYRRDVIPDCPSPPFSAPHQKRIVALLGEHTPDELHHVLTVFKAEAQTKLDYGLGPPLEFFDGACVFLDRSIAKALATTPEQERLRVMPRELARQKMQESAAAAKEREKRRRDASVPATTPLTPEEAASSWAEALSDQARRDQDDGRVTVVGEYMRTVYGDRQPARRHDGAHERQDAAAPRSAAHADTS